MRTAVRLIEPRHFESFHCIGADCEDTCCDGWAVAVDKAAYEKYRDCPDPQWRASFEKLITIQPANPTDHDYARIRLEGTACAFLSEGLCSIQKNLGEDYLPVTCASFPRVWNRVDQALEISLDLSCPEAARVALLDPEPMSFLEKPIDGRDYRSVRFGVLNTSPEIDAAKPYAHFFPARAFIRSLLQNRALSLWKRILILGFFCDKLQEIGSGGDKAQIPDMIQAYEAAVSAGSFDSTLDQFTARLSVRIETVVELIVARISSDFTNRRFLQSYKEFMDGLQWGPDSTMEQLRARFSAVYSQYFAPFMAAHSHMLEHYLVNYARRSLFPFGPQESTYGLGEQHRQPIHDEFMLLALHYSIIETLLVGVAGFYKKAFAAEHVIRAVYTCTRTFEHSLPFSGRVIRALEEKGLNNLHGAAILIKT